MCLSENLDGHIPSNFNSRRTKPLENFRESAFAAVFDVVREQFRASGSSHDFGSAYIPFGSLTAPHAAAQQDPGSCRFIYWFNNQVEHLRFSKPTHGEAIALGSPSRKMALAGASTDDVLHAPFWISKWSVIPPTNESCGFVGSALLTLPLTLCSTGSGVMRFIYWFNNQVESISCFSNPTHGEAIALGSPSRKMALAEHQPMMYSMLCFGYPKWSVIPTDERVVVSSVQRSERGLNLVIRRNEKVSLFMEEAEVDVLQRID
ncbi:hypothetical protein Bca52824_082112 [Brassica carinata]|uniref:Uncharacterized protein n=1 Tax=Brassica carinata TaxID=52824 RepID=A0A8X7TTW0_BRACI|nr:hypothetical protein Bca52824_082112 [Brassica carinata]